MSDTARAADGEDDGAVPFSSAAVPAIGTVLSAVTLAALLIPVRRGTDEIALSIAAAAAAVAVGSFLARRHGRLERRVAGPVAAAASLLVVALSGYAITQGVLGSVVLPGTESSISALFLAFLLAAAAVGFGVAEYAAISGSGLVARLRATIEMLLLAAAGLFTLSIAMVLLSQLAAVAVGEPTAVQETVIEYVSLAVGIGAVAAAYLGLRERDAAFIDLEPPTLRTVGWIAVGLALILGANVGISALMELLGIDGAEHTATREAVENPDLLFVIVPSMILIVGPFEELLYRNVIQKTLYETFSRPGAVVVASVVFAAVHLTAYATAGPGRMLASLSLVFVLGLILGAIYERTENLLVPALVHGGYNATVFAMLFV